MKTQFCNHENKNKDGICDKCLGKRQWYRVSYYTTDPVKASEAINQFDDSLKSDITIEKI